MALYRYRQVEAMQFTGDIDAMTAWLKEHGVNYTVTREETLLTSQATLILPPGSRIVHQGNWVVLRGGVDLMSDWEFQTTYEPVEATQDTDAKDAAYYEDPANIKAGRLILTQKGS